MMSKVLIVNKSNHDFTDAERYGELVFMSYGPINRYATNQMVRKFQFYIDKSKPDDYLLITGLSVMSTIAGSMMALKHGRLNLLLYRSSIEDGTTSYIERKIVFTKQMEKTNEKNK